MVTKFVDANFQQLKQAVDTANHGDVIMIGAGTVDFTGVLQMKKDIELCGTVDEFSTPRTIFNGGDNVRHLYVGDNFPSVNLILRNIIFEHGFVKWDVGGSIDFRTKQGEFGTLDAYNCTWRKNKGRTGAVALRNWTIGNFINCRFEDNATNILEIEPATAPGGWSKAGYGGAVSVWTNSQVHFSRCVFQRNKGINGGAIATVFAGLTVNKCIFHRNEATSQGGAIYHDGGSPVLDAKFLQPEHQADYKATPMHGDYSAVTGSSFIDNLAESIGGAFAGWFYSHDSIRFEETIFYGNEVNSHTGVGGAVYLNRPLHAAFRDCDITRNVAHLEGGGLLYIGQRPVHFSNVRFNENMSSSGSAMNLAFDAKIRHNFQHSGYVLHNNTIHIKP